MPMTGVMNIDGSEYVKIKIILKDPEISILHCIHSSFGRLAEHKGKCYVPESCPCIWKDWEYLSGEVIATPCYTW